MNRNNRSNRSSRSHHNNRSRSGRGGNRRQRSNSNSKRYGGRNKKKLDINTFINKATAQENAEENATPNHAFDDFAIRENLKRAISAQGFSSPTPIQDQAIPHILEGRDIVGVAATGTGKTAAFLIPLINKALENGKEKTLIVTPTRELANQVAKEVRKLTPKMHIFSVCCVGGVSIRPQIRDLKRNHNFVVGTPGRLKDLIERGELTLSKINTIVLDEADRMLDMGFIGDMRSSYQKCPQTTTRFSSRQRLAKRLNGS